MCRLGRCGYISVKILRIANHLENAKPCQRLNGMWSGTDHPANADRARPCGWRSAVRVGKPGVVAANAVPKVLWHAAPVLRYPLARYTWNYLDLLPDGEENERQREPTRLTL